MDPLKVSFARRCAHPEPTCNAYLLKLSEMWFCSISSMSSRSLLIWSWQVNSRSLEMCVQRDSSRLVCIFCGRNPEAWIAGPLESVKNWQITSSSACKPCSILKWGETWDAFPVWDFCSFGSERHHNEHTSSLIIFVKRIVLMPLIAVKNCLA